MFFLNNKSKLQNILIVILCFTVMLEVRQLWFVNLSSGQVFQQGEKLKSSNIEEKKDFLSPFRIAVNNTTNINQNEFYVLYEGDDYENILNNSQNMLDLYSKSNFVESKQLDNSIFENDEAIIFEYTFLLDSKMLVDALELSKNSFNKVDKFDKLCFIKSNDNINIIFINSDENIYTKYEADENVKRNQMDFRLKDTDKYNKYAYNLNSDSKISKLELIENVDGKEYSNIYAQNPFATIYGDSTRNLVESKVDKYFQNVLYMKFSPSETAYVFSDTDTVVKYFNSGILEYSYYNIPTTVEETNIVLDFVIAKNFIETDTDIINNYYLKDYSANKFETVFKFDYIINNYPVKFTKDEKMMDSAIEVTVKNNTVTNMKKIVYNYNISENTNVVSKSLSQAISVLSNEKESENTAFVEDVILGYKVSEVEEESGLYWFMDAFNNEISLSTN